MNIFVCIMVLFCILGCIDKMIGNKMNLASAFDKGLNTMGGFIFSVCGFYCIFIQLIQQNASWIINLTKNAPIDFSILIGSILAPDLGGYSIIAGVSNNPAFIIFSGLLLTSSIGCTISFQLPIFLGSLEKKDIADFLNGLIFGIMTLPIPLFIFGILLHVPNLLINLLPILGICILLLICLIKMEKGTIQFLSKFAKAIEILGNILFILVIISFFFHIPFTTPDLILESLQICFQMSICVCGAMVLSDIILRYGKNAISKVSKLLDVNEVSVVGFILQFGTAIAMIPLFKDMDKKGKLMNAAFGVAGAYVFGGQLGFVSNVVSSYNTTIYIVFKLCAGFIAILVTYIFTKKKTI